MRRRIGFVRICGKCLEVAIPDRLRENAAVDFHPFNFKIQR